MKTVTAKEAHSNLGSVLSESQLEPVVIEKNGKPFSVVISMKDFEEQERLRLKEEACIDARIVDAEKSYVEHGGIPINQAFNNVRSVLIADEK